MSLKGYNSAYTYLGAAVRRYNLKNWTHPSTEVAGLSKQPYVSSLTKRVTSLAGYLLWAVAPSS